MAILLLLGGVFLSLTTINYNTLYLDTRLLKAHWISRAGLNQMIHDVKDHYFSYEKFLQTQKTYADGVKFGDGIYRACIGLTTGPGIREILIISEGIVDSDKKDAMLTRIRISTPADYLKFIDGHFTYSGQAWWDKVLWGGPIHVNGSIRFSLADNLSSGPYLHIRKDAKLKGPVISSTGIVFHDGMYQDRPPILVGEGDVSGSFNGDTDINNYTPETRSNNLTISTFYINQYPAYYGLLNKPVLLEFPGGKSPDIIFEVTKPDGTKQPLLTDGFHGGYNITIPKKEKILTEFQPYIDPEWHITYDNLAGGRIVSFYNDDMRNKTQVSGGGTTYSFTSAGVEELGDIKTSSYYGSTDNSNPDNYNIASSSNSNAKYIDFYPNKRFINKLYEDSSGASPIDESNYQVKYNIGAMPSNIDLGMNMSGRIIFNGPGYTPASRIYSTKVRAIYVTNDTENYTAFGMDLTIAEASHRKGIRVSPVNYQINDSAGTVTFKNSINEQPLLADKAGVVYQTANLVDQNSVVVTSVSGYKYSGDVNNPTLTKTTSNPPITWLYSTVGFQLAFYTIPDKCFMDMYGNVVDASGGYVTFMPRKYLGSMPGPPWYDENHYATATYMPYPPVVQKPGTGIGGAAWGAPPSPPPAEPSEVHLYYLNTSVNTAIPVDTNDTGFIPCRLYEIFPDGHTVNTSDPGNTIDLVGTYPWTYSTTDFGWNGGFYVCNFYDFRFTNLRPTYPVLMSYKYKYRPVTNVSAIISPLNVSYASTPDGISGVSFSGFKAVCIDPFVKAVEIDLSNINSNNYPGKGVIFSDVPLIVKGIPKKEITVVCLQDVYLGPINATYYRSDGSLVDSDLADGDSRAYPVGIISAGAVWNFFHLNRRVPIPLETTSDPSFYVKLNKVAIYTQGDSLFNYSGLAWTNTGGLIGSFISGTSQMGPDVFKAKYLGSNYAGAGTYNQGNFNPWGTNPQKYVSSFRRNLPPHFPTDIKLRDWQAVSASNAEQYINELQKYLRDSSYSDNPERLEEKYTELVNKYMVELKK